MKLYFPFKKWTITQPFAANYNTLYKSNGRLGHEGLDIFAIGDRGIYAACDSYIFATRNKDNPDPMQYRAVYSLVEDAGVFYEVSYGHCDDIYVSEGTLVKRGVLLATEGNTGPVYSSGKAVTREEKLAGSTKGTHLHFQVRLVKPVEKIEKGKKYLYDSLGSKFKKDGKIFEILNYDNGYLGCIDPLPFMMHESAFIEHPKGITKTLKYGSRGIEVATLQQFLSIPADGIFGIQTEKSVKEFQKKNKLTIDGIVGPKTAALINGGL